LASLRQRRGIVSVSVATMKFFLVMAMLVGQVVATETKEHPIAKIVNMLKELQVKAREQGDVEAVAYQKFQYWCKNTIKELTGVIEKEKATIETLEDKIESKKKLIKTLEDDIELLTKELEDYEEAASKAKKIREETLSDYEEADKDADSTIGAIQDCIDSLEDAKPSLLSHNSSIAVQNSVKNVLGLASARISNQDRAVLLGFLQDEQPSKPKAKKYSFKSQGVIELLKKLKEQFEDDKLEGTKAETNSLNQYNLAKDARDQAIKAAEKSKEEKEDIKGEAEGDLAEAEKDLKSTEDDLKADEESHETTVADCELKADEWKTRVATRDGEIKAMGMAIKIMAKVGGVRAPPSGELIQATSFLQIDDPKTKAAEILVAEAQKLQSRNAKALRNLAQEITSHQGGPFDDINEMIQKMIFRLMSEQKDEDDHKSWCDTELEKSEESEEEKKDKKQELGDKIEEADAKTMELANELSDLTKELSDLTNEMREATETRTEEHAENSAAIKDAKAAQDACTMAMEVLTDFYKDAGKEFIQTHHRKPVKVDAPPDTWGSSYSGLDKEPDGILSMMETISEDFSTMESDTKAEEDSNQKAYDEEITVAEVDKAEKEKTMSMKTNERGLLLGKMKSWKKQEVSVTQALETVQQYLKDLQPACVEGDSSYEDRKKARDDETEALRKAQKTLEEAFKSKDFLQKSASINHH